jgi:adenosylhomocysteine nucleosidase
MAEAWPDPLIVMALEIESQGVFAQAGVPVLYTGVGKVNATYALTRRLADYRCAGRPLPRVVNFGTAGSRRFPLGALVGCHAFVQRDMDVSAMGLARGATPFEEVLARLEFPVTFEHLPAAVCSSGDSFETGEAARLCDVIDMEGYALAKVCWRERVAFACAKFITDGADPAAASDCHSNLPRAAAGFLDLYRSHLGTSS